MFFDFLLLLNNKKRKIYILNLFITIQYYIKSNNDWGLK